jgi:hypothetical protein
MEVPLGHTVPPVGLGDGAATHEHAERCISVVPQKEPYFPPPVRGTERREVEVWINFAPGSDEDVHTTQSHCLRARVLLYLGAKEVVPQIEVELNPHIGLAQSDKCRHV